MQMVFAEATLLVQLRKKDLVQRLFGTSHSFHVVDIVADQLDGETKSLFFASGLIEQSLGSSEMMQLADACRTLTCACVGQAASLIYAETSGSGILSASIPFIKVERVKRCGVHDLDWVEATLSSTITPSKL